MFKEQCMENLKECGSYMYGSYITFENLMQHKDYINFHEANKLKGWLVELYEKISRLECVVTSKAEYWEELGHE